MRIECGLQAGHSDFMRVLAEFVDEERAQEVHVELLRHLEALFARGEKFSCAAFGRSFKNQEEYAAWKAKEWDPIADERCTLEVEPKNGGIYVRGEYGLILDDWSRDEVDVGLSGSMVVVRAYTAGYGIDYLSDWFTERGGEANVEVEGCDPDLVPLTVALKDLADEADAAGTDRLRAEDSPDHPTGPGGDGGVPGQEAEI